MAVIPCSSQVFLCALQPLSLRRIFDLLPRLWCLVAVLPHNELMVVGGVTPNSGIHATDTVEIATIV